MSHFFRRTAFSMAMLALVSCAPFTAPGTRARAGATEPAREYATRLVLALDGVDYRDVMAAREQGMFTSFRTPSRLVSTFPSISDIAWHEIFGVLPPRGYQRIYYSNARNAMVGGSLDAITPIEFENRMDLAFGTKLHHLGAYLMSGTVSRREVNVTAEKFFDITGRPTVYVYNVGPDALQHTRGDLTRYFRYLDGRLTELQREYLARTGRPLEIAILSDHGHNHAADARFLPVVEALRAKGYRAASALATANDVAFSVDGVTTGFGVFCQPTAIDSVAHALAELEGVDIVSTMESPYRFHVMSRRAGESGASALATAVIERRHYDAVEQYRYLPTEGDPLEAAEAVKRMQGDGSADAGGWATAEAWLQHTATSRFPVAVVRIVRGHTTVTLNPAPVLVSVADGFRVGLGMVSIANRMRPLGGTHGGLSNSNSLGVLMTNFVDTHDDLTANVRAQLGGFDDLRTPVREASGARVSSASMVQRDRFAPFSMQPDIARDANAPALDVWLSPDQRAWASDSGTLIVEVQTRERVEHATDRWKTVARQLWSVPSAVASADRSRFFLPLNAPGTSGLSPRTEYSLRVMLSQRPALDSSTLPAGTRDITRIPARTNASGALIAY